MTTYSYAQLEGLWIAAGGSRATAPVAAAIAVAESGGNSDAFNPRDSNGRGGIQASAGLWQVSNGTTTPPAGWSTPAVNAQLAVAKFRGAGNSFRPWGTFTSGAFRAHLSNKTTPATNIPGSPTAATAASVAAASADCFVPNPLSVSVPIVGTISAGPVCLLSKSQARAVWAVVNIGAGVFLLGLGFAFVAVWSRPGRAFINLVTSFIPGEGGGVIARGQSQAAKEDARMERELGGARENPDLEVRGGTVREDDLQRQARRRRERAAARTREPATAAEAGF